MSGSTPPRSAAAVGHGMATARQRSRYFWGLHPVCTLGGLPILFALTGSKADERETL
ncbi:MAG: hypothetical protein QOC83_752, partial [Pseudonocardiales bacterium]|nr:hypothetical protein [Pseudonocardiales bacterium]